ncbi:lysylphosphatidylglycerol synthase transmembrane domain-containing protein [Raoultibacter massiliensis]|uniref:lysylphosphatidylglycerol synthase transmembrane domain-containing protein n=1 Tax=Raoultibacter massiliensis TaxID=1852371 RepID=UPI003A91B4DB
MKFSIQKLMMGLVIVIVLAFVLLRGDQLVELVETMKKGAVIPLIAAVLTQLCKYFAQSFAYSYSFSAVEEKMEPRETLPLVFGTFFMNTIAPSLNMAGATLVVDDAHRRGISAGKATSAALLMQMSIESGFMTIMIIGFVILEFAGQLDPLWFLLGLVVVLLVAVMGSIMVLGHKKPALLMRMLRPVERLVNRVRVRLKKEPLKPWIESAVTSFGDAAVLIVKNPKTTAKVFGCSILASTCELACFCLVGIAFDVYIPQALICGYVVATLFAMISVTPQGVGVVEAAVLVLFTSYGVAGAAGMAIALVYRGLVFWMPFLIGAVLIQRTKSFRRDKSDKGDKNDVKHPDERDRTSVKGATLDGKRLGKGDSADDHAMPWTTPLDGQSDQPSRDRRADDLLVQQKRGDSSGRFDSASRNRKDNLGNRKDT